MNTTLDKALDKARELLEAMGYEVAEQAEQEPVAIMSPNKANIVGINTPYANIGTDDWIKLYAAPVRTKDLTVSELGAIIERHYDDEMDLKAMILDGIAADRKKNK